jgi:hypothetical protein
MATAGIVAWFLIGVGGLTLINLLFVETALFISLLIIKKHARTHMISFKQLFESSFPPEDLLVALVLFFILLLALQTGWLNISWNQIPWFDAWEWWSRGFSSSMVGRFWDPGYLSIGNSPAVSGLLGSIFSIYPEKVPSLYFMKLFSLFLVYLVSLWVYHFSHLFLAKIGASKKISSMLPAFSAVCFMTNSWTLFYTAVFVRELLALTLFLGALSVQLSEANNQKLQLIFCAFISMSIFVIEPFTALYSWAFAGALLVMGFAKVGSKVARARERLSLRNLFFACFILIVIALFAVLIILYPLSPGEKPVLENIRPTLISYYWIVYYITSTGGFLSLALAFLGLLFVIYKIGRNREGSRYLVCATFLFIFVSLITFVFPLPSFVARHAVYLGLVISVMSSVGIIMVVEIANRIALFSNTLKALSLNKKALISIFLLTLLLIQFSYGLMHVQRIDHSNEQEVVDLLAELDKKLPKDCIVIADGPLVDKAIGLLSPRRVQTWGLIKDFQNAPNNVSVLLSLIDFAIKKQIYFVALSGGNYLLENILLSSLMNIEVVSANYDVTVYHVGIPNMLLYGYRDIDVFNFSSASGGVRKPVIGIALDEFDARTNSSANVREINMQYEGSSLRVSMDTYENSSAWIWMVAKLPNPVNINDYGLLLMNVSGSAGSYINVGFSNSSQLLQIYIGDQSVEQPNYIFDLTKYLKPFYGSSLLSSNLTYVWVALAGNGHTTHSFDIGSVSLSGTVFQEMPAASEEISSSMIPLPYVILAIAVVIAMLLVLARARSRTCS